MILYLDASALVKKYIQELGTTDVLKIISQSEAVGTSIISRAETAAALAKAHRLKILTKSDAEKAAQQMRQEWLDFIRIQVTEAIVVRADFVAWEHSLRGFDAIHLATALVWSEQLPHEQFAFATFDRQLWQAVRDSNLTPFPPNLPGLLAQWQEHKV